MAAPATNSKATCPECGASLSATMRHCPTCRSDAGAPNVRRCRTDENLKALVARFDDAKARTSANNCAKEFSDLESAIKKKSGVVISMPVGVARQLLEDLNFIYTDYENLVGANIRRPANPENDRHRCAAGGVMFGSYANSIIYGVLSLTEKGLSTYGDVHCRLRSVTIDKRTSFLETNNYKFIQDHNIGIGDTLPEGYMACWEDKHMLVLAKLVNHISSGQTETDWQNILILSDDQNRQNDDFVEAHIYKGFDGNAIESLIPDCGKRLSREKKLDLKIVMLKFNRLRGETK